MKMKPHIYAAIVLLFLHQDVCSALEILPSANPAILGQSVTLTPSPPTVLNSGTWSVGDVLILNWVGDQEGVFSNHSGRASIDDNRALTLTSLTDADSGVYTLKSTDPVLTASVTIAVLEPISNVTVKTNDLTLIELSDAAIASCSVESGSSVSFHWFNGSSELTDNDRVHFTDGNTTLTIVNVTRYDQGPFTCSALNPISNDTSDPLNFTICYGPDSMSLTLGSYNIGSNVTMVCSAESSPPAQMQWAFNEELLNATGSVLELNNVTKDQSGYYSCLAFNNETNLSHNITGLLEIKDPNSASEHLAASLWILPLLLLTGMIFPLFSF